VDDQYGGDDDCDKGNGRDGEEPPNPHTMILQGNG
jgi:hypothetical protein